MKSMFSQLTTIQGNSQILGEEAILYEVIFIQLLPKCPGKLCMVLLFLASIAYLSRVKPGLNGCALNPLIPMLPSRTLSACWNLPRYTTYLILTFYSRLLIDTQRLLTYLQLNYCKDFESDHHNLTIGSL